MGAVIGAIIAIIVFVIIRVIQKTDAEGYLLLKDGTRMKNKKAQDVKQTPLWIYILMSFIFTLVASVIFGVIFFGLSSGDFSSVMLI